MVNVNPFTRSGRRSMRTHGGNPHIEIAEHGRSVRMVHEMITLVQNPRGAELMKKRTCLVTGASRGIGAAISSALVDAGYEVLGLARQRPQGWSGDFIECDFLDRERLSEVCDEIAGSEDLWALVNNAGMGHADSLGEASLDDMRRVFMVNTFAPWLVTRAAAEAMRSGGRIVNICSTAILGKAERNAYGASKGALACLARTWALELAPQGITVNSISPGPIETELFRSRNPVGSDIEKDLLRAIPVGHFGTVEQVAATVRYLIEPSTSYLTGENIFLDGGSSVGRARG